MTIFEIHDNLQRIISEGGIKGIARETVIEDGDIIVNLVKNQMQKGVRGGVRKEVARLGWYTPKGGWQNDQGPSAYAIMKHAMNSEPGLGIVDLKFTGQFYSQFYFDSGDMEVYSHDSKTDILIERYGENIFKMTPDSISEYRPIFNPKVRSKFLAKLKGE